MEDLVRYSIISIGVIYAIYKIKIMIWDKKYGCSTCSLKNTCNKKTCEISNIKLTDLEKENIKKIKLVYKN